MCHGCCIITLRSAAHALLYCVSVLLALFITVCGEGKLRRASPTEAEMGEHHTLI